MWLSFSTSPLRCLVPSRKYWYLSFDEGDEVFKSVQSSFRALGEALGFLFRVFPLLFLLNFYHQASFGNLKGLRPPDGFSSPVFEEVALRPFPLD